MSYQVLARKYRPRTFHEMVGQETTVRALINALEQQRLHHAYLFTGTRGVGKTTVARILAKCLNCEAGVSATPCGTCQACLEIDQNRYIDLLEVDAASRTKVEDTRELLENVQYTPQRGRYKIYLIDEVHMLSGHSFNALLKTLEEPPAHVIFLLATTDPQRMPATVLSRCLQFHLKNISVDIITSQLMNILAKENIAYETNALNALANAAEGSMRDALSLLDQSIAYGNGKISEKDVIAMLGTISQQKIDELLALLAEQNAELLLSKIDELAELGVDFLAVLENILSRLQKIAVAQLLKKSDSETIMQLATRFKAEDIQLYYQIGLIGKRDLPIVSDPKSGFIMTMIRMLAFTPNNTTKLTSTEFKPTPKELPKEPIKPVAQEKSIQKTIENPTEKTQWANILSKLNLTGVTQLLAANCVLSQFSDENIELLLDPAQAALLNITSKERLTIALQTYMGKPCKLTITIAKSNNETPAQVQQRVSNEKHQAAQESIINDQQVQNLMQKFSAKIQPESITPLGDGK